MKFWLRALLVLLVSAPSLAETMYIDDTMYAPLRSGEGLEFRIIHKGLKSGTKVQVIRHNPDSGYSLIKVDDDLQGWMPTRFLIAEPIARDKLNAALTELEKTKSQLLETKSAMSAGNKESQALLIDRNALDADNKRLGEELAHLRDISSNAVMLDERNRELQESNQKLIGDLELMNAEVQRLKDKKEQDFLLLGGGLVLAGVIITLIIPALRRNKRSDSWA